MLTLDRLLSNGWIDEAYAKKKGIGRLPAQIHRLRAKGYTILAIRNGNKSKYVIGEP
jgi:predicted transcriptional regulator